MEPISVVQNHVNFILFISFFLQRNAQRIVLWSSVKTEKFMNFLLVSVTDDFNPIMRFN